MLTGQRPFSGDSHLSILSSILRDSPPSISELKRMCPRYLERIILRCVAKEPERRFQTVLDVRNELAELKEEIDSGTIALPGGMEESGAPGRIGWLPSAPSP